MSPDSEGKFPIVYLSTFVLVALLVLTLGRSVWPDDEEDESRRFPPSSCSGPRVQPAATADQLIAIDRARAGTDVMVVELGSGEPRRLTDEFPTNNPAWSPDGKRIAFFSYKSGADDALYSSDPDGGDLRRITDISNSAEGLAWSPDGRHIAFADNGIFMVDIDGRNLVQFTDYDMVDIDPLSWSPDGIYIAFTGEYQDPESGTVGPDSDSSTSAIGYLLILR